MDVMAYDEQLADRVRACVAGACLGPDCPGRADERRMFGGLAFLVAGHMALAVSGQGGLMVRTDPAAVAPLLAQPHVEQVVMQRRAMPGWLGVAPAALADDDALQAWVERAVGYVRTLPPKRPRSGTTR